MQVMIKLELLITTAIELEVTNLWTLKLKIFNQLHYFVVLKQVIHQEQASIIKVLPPH